MLYRFPTQSKNTRFCAQKEVHTLLSLAGIRVLSLALAMCSSAYNRCSCNTPRPNTHAGNSTNISTRVRPTLEFERIRVMCACVCFCVSSIELWKKLIVVSEMCVCGIHYRRMIHNAFVHSHTFTCTVRLLIYYTLHIRCERYDWCIHIPRAHIHDRNEELFHIHTHICGQTNHPLIRLSTQTPTGKYDDTCILVCTLYIHFQRCTSESSTALFLLPFPTGWHSANQCKWFSKTDGMLPQLHHHESAMLFAGKNTHNSLRVLFATL